MPIMNGAYLGSQMLFTPRTFGIRGYVEPTAGESRRGRDSTLRYCGAI
jgi:hypothetical protein